LLGKVTTYLITLMSGAYAIYQKFYFAEFNMHTRLDQFQQRFNTRLKDSNKHILKALLRPGPVREFESPIFTDETLDPVLRNMKWGNRPGADTSLADELRNLEKQLRLWDGQKKEYELRKAQVCLLKGAIAAARAAKTSGDDARKANVEALEHFQEAFNLSDKKDPEALEYVGHQLVRLGDYNAALGSFQDLAKMEPTEGSSLLRARALKFQAEVHECRPQPNLKGATSALIEAVRVLPTDAPQIEKAEIHEMHGRIREKAEAFDRATQSYTAAELWYQRIVDKKNSDDVPVAKEGLKRVRDALQRIRLRPLTPNGVGARWHPCPMCPKTRRDLAEDESSEDAKTVGRDSCKKRMGRTCVSSGFEKSGNTQRREAWLELSLVSHRCVSQYGRTQEQKIPGAIEGAEHRDCQDRAVGDHRKVPGCNPRISSRSRSVHEATRLYAAPFRVVPAVFRSGELCRAFGTFGNSGRDARQPQQQCNQQHDGGPQHPRSSNQIKFHGGVMQYGSRQLGLRRNK
jgi:tetratricopeptide (TPR) repeat protein